MLRVLLSKYRHSAPRFLLLLFILTLASAFFCLSLQLYTQSVDSMEAIENNTTTLAIEKLSVRLSEDGNYLVTGSEDAQKAALASSAVLAPHPSTSLSGRIRGLTPVLPSPLQQSVAGGAKGDMLNTERQCAMRVRCDSVSAVEENKILFQFDGTYEVSDTLTTSYTAYLTLLEPLVVNRNDKLPDKQITVYYNYVYHDGTPLFEQGKEYVVFGTYWPIRPEVYTNKLGKTIVVYDATYDNYFINLKDCGTYSSRISYDENGTGHETCYLPANALPILAPDDPRLPQALEMAALNAEMLYVTGISTVQGVPLFAMQEAQIIKGRDFTKEESERGDKVCLVSESFAALNGLSLGDTVTVDMYQNNISLITLWDQPFYRASVYEGDLAPAYSAPYTIVGMYKSMEWEENRYCFSPNPVFVTQNSIIIDGCEGLDYADSLILQNGSNDQFVADLAAKGIPEDAYTIYDGGYMQFMESLFIMRQDTGVMLIVCTLLFLMLSVAALGMMHRHLKSDTLIMARIGASGAKVRLYEAGCILPCILLSAFFSYGVCLAAHQPLSQLLETYYALPKPMFSDLPASITGMLTGNLSAHPPVTGCLMAIGFCTLLTLYFACRERSAA